MSLDDDNARVETRGRRLGGRFRLTFKQSGDLGIIGGYWLLFAYCLGASLVVRLLAPSLPVLVWFSFSGVIVAAILISWGAEAAQFVVSQGLAIAIIALLQVVPEFMVEATIAWHREIDLMMANFTGSNRLLMGVGWPLVFFAADGYNKLKSGHGIPHVELRRETVIEVLALMLSSAYFILVLLHGELDALDSVALAGIFAVYMVLLQRLPEEEGEKKEELLVMPRYLATLPRWPEQFYKLAGIFFIGGLTMWAMAEPFLKSMQTLAAVLGVSAFVFVQWCAPFLSEFPEKVTAFYWARSVRLAPLGLLNLISSNVNQLTLLVAMIPLVYSASLGQWSSVPLDTRHHEEIFLSLMVTLYGGSTLLKLQFTRLNAVSLFGLWLVQFIFPSQLPLLGNAAWNNTRLLTALAFGILIASELTRHRRDIHLRDNLRLVAMLVRGSKPLQPESGGRGPSQ